MKRGVQLDAFYPVPPERVWRALTDPVALAQWLRPNDFEPRVGHRFQFRAAPRPGWRGIVDCEVTELDPPRRLSYSWKGDPDWKSPTVVTWTLAPEGEGTRLRLQHTDFEGLTGWVLSLILKGGWRSMLRSKLPAVLGL